MLSGFFARDQKFSKPLGILRVTPERDPQTASRLSHAVIHWGAVNIFISSANAIKATDRFKCGKEAAPKVIGLDIAG